jgi:hypothetical protein
MTGGSAAGGVSTSKSAGASPGGEDGGEGGAGAPGVPVSGSVSTSGPRGAPVRVGVAAAAAAFGCTVVPVTTPVAPTVVPVTTPGAPTVVPVTTREALTVVPVTTPVAPTVVPGKAEKEVHAGRVTVRSDLTLA